MSITEQDVFLVPSQFSCISNAIDAVMRPSTIMVGPGVYREDLLLVDKPDIVINSTAFGRRGVILVGDTLDSVITIENSRVYLSGLEIRSNNRARAIWAFQSSVSLQECVLAGNRVHGAATEARGAGMLCIGSSVRVQKSMIAGNTVEHVGCASGGGLHLMQCKVEIAGSSIQANAVYGAAAAKGGGIYCERSQMRMWRSRVTDNALFGANCCGAGIYFKDSTAQLGGGVITGNGAVDAKGGGIFVSGNSDQVVIHRNTDVRRNHPDDLMTE